MSASSSSSLTTSCDTTFISSDSSTLSYDGPSNLEKGHNDTSLSFSQMFTARRKARACSVPHILPSVNNSETSPASLHLTDGPPKILENSSKNSMYSSSFRDIRRLDGSTLSNSFLRTNKTTFGVKQKFRRSSYSLTLALEDPIPDDAGPCFPPRSSSIKKLFQAPSPRINQLKQEEGMERETTHERSTHINLLLSNTWEDLALDGFDKEKNCSTKNSKDSPMSDHAIDQADQNGNHGYHTDFSAFKNDAMNGKSLLSPNSNNAKSNNPYLPFRAISSPTGKCYASKRSLSPVIKLKPSSICIKRKYDSDNESCASSPPIKKHHSYSLTTECNPNLTSIFNSNPCPNPYDNRSLPPSPARLFDFAHGTSRSCSPCYSEESNRAYEIKLNELDCVASAGCGNNGSGVAKCCPNTGLPITCPSPLKKQSYLNKGYNLPLRLGFSPNNVDCQDNKSFNHYSHSLRAKSLISPLSFRCFPSRDMMGSPLPSLWSPTLTRTTVAPSSTNDGYDDCSTVDEAVLGTSYYGTPDSTEGPFETNKHYTPSPRSCVVSPIAASAALAYNGSLSPASSSYSQSLYSSSSKDIFCHVTPSTSHNSGLTCFVPIHLDAHPDDPPRPDRQLTPQQCIASPADSAIDVGCIEATVYSNAIAPFPKNHSDQMDIDGRDVPTSRPPLPTTVVTPERSPIIYVPLTSR